MRIEDTVAFDPSCAARHCVEWMVEPDWFRRAAAAVKSGAMQIRSADTMREGRDVLYEIVGDGIAVMSLAGHLMKGDSKYGGTNSLRARRAVRHAAANNDVKGILLAIDSPGGTVAGTGDLAADIASARKAKPVFAHIDDLGASAAYWLATQAEEIGANPTAEVGSIGTVAVVEDTSGRAEADGIRVHVISTGEFKGAFADGAPVSDEHLAYLQERVDDLNSHFLGAVSKGRKLPIADVRAVADGRVYIASKAKSLGLIDHVRSMDDSMTALRRRVGRGERAAMASKRISS